MDINEAIKKRRSIRKFTDKKVDRQIIEKVIYTATHAPSACNVQGWKFIITENQDIKNKIVNLGGSIIIKDAPMGILVVYDNQTKNTEYKDDIQSASAAIQNINLAAIEAGLGTCWICHLPPKRQLRKLFKIPNSFSPIAYILVGYPASEPQTVKRRYNPTEIINYDKFSADWPVNKINWLALWTKKILMKIYYLLPTFVKTKLVNKFIDRNFVKKFKN